MVDESNVSVPETKAQVMLQSMQRALSVLGESGRAATIYMLKTKYGLSEKPTDPREISDAIRHIFGLGSAIILRAMRDDLKSIHAPDKAVQFFIDQAAAEFESAAYGVEHGIA